MKVCSKCKTKIDSDDKRFCPNCGAALKAPTVRYEPVYEESREVYEDCPYSMTWHMFFTHIGIWILAAVYVFMAVLFFTGEIQGFLTNNEMLSSRMIVAGDFAILAVLTPLFGGYMLLSAISCIITRFKLGRYKEDAPKHVRRATTSGITITIVYLVLFFFITLREVENAEIALKFIFNGYELICPATIYFFGLIILSFANKTYYYKRRSLFNE